MTELLDMGLTQEQWNKGRELHEKIEKAIHVISLPLDIIKADEGHPWAHMSSKCGSTSNIVTFIREEQSKRDEPLSFLDLGCSYGFVVALAAHLGCKSYGIEYEEKYVDFGKKRLDEAIRNGLETKFEPKIDYGNFFPKDFDITPNIDPKAKAFINLNDENFSESRKHDPYKTLGITPWDIDIFYHFQVQSFEQVTQFFSRYGKIGSFLLFNATSGRNLEETLKPENVVLAKKPYEDFYIFQKIDSLH
jgi:SAM-dependent methyltransferase